MCLRYNVSAPRALSQAAQKVHVPTKRNVLYIYIYIYMSCLLKTMVPPKNQQHTILLESEHLLPHPSKWCTTSTRWLPHDYTRPLRINSPKQPLGTHENISNAASYLWIYDSRPLGEQLFFWAKPSYRTPRMGQKGKGGMPNMPMNPQMMGTALSRVSFLLGGSLRTVVQV